MAAAGRDGSLSSDALVSQPAVWQLSGAGRAGAATRRLVRACPSRRRPSQLPRSWLSAARERRRRSCPRRTPAMTRTTTIARSAPRSFSPRPLSCRRRRNCRCRSFLKPSNISIASRSFSSRRGARHFNHALLRSPDRLLLIFGIAALASFAPAMCAGSNAAVSFDISTCRVSTTADGPADWPFLAEFRGEASCLFVLTAQSRILLGVARCLR